MGRILRFGGWGWAVGGWAVGGWAVGGWGDGRERRTDAKGGEGALQGCVAEVDGDGVYAEGVGGERGGNVGASVDACAEDGGVDEKLDPGNGNGSCSARGGRFGGEVDGQDEEGGFAGLDGGGGRLDDGLLALLAGKEGPNPSSVVLRRQAEEADGDHLFVGQPRDARAMETDEQRLVGVLGFLEQDGEVNGCGGLSEESDFPAVVVGSAGQAGECREVEVSPGGLVSVAAGDHARGQKEASVRHLRLGGDRVTAAGLVLHFPRRCEALATRHTL